MNKIRIIMLFVIALSIISCDAKKTDSVLASYAGTWFTLKGTVLVVDQNGVGSIDDGGVISKVLFVKHIQVDDVPGVILKIDGGSSSGSDYMAVVKRDNDQFLGVYTVPSQDPLMPYIYFSSAEDVEEVIKNKSGKLYTGACRVHPVSTPFTGGSWTDPMTTTTVITYDPNLKNFPKLGHTAAEIAVSDVSLAYSAPTLIMCNSTGKDPAFSLIMINGSGALLEQDLLGFFESGPNDSKTNAARKVGNKKT